MNLLIAAGAAAVGAGCWVAAPFVNMARRGTVDQQTKAAMREEGIRAEALRRARRREAIVASIPAQRTADAQRRSALRG